MNRRTLLRVLAYGLGGGILLNNLNTGGKAAGKKKLSKSGAVGIKHYFIEQDETAARAARKHRDELEIPARAAVLKVKIKRLKILFLQIGFPRQKIAQTDYILQLDFGFFRVVRFDDAQIAENRAGHEFAD